MYIVITLPYFFEGEAEAITLMFQSGLERLHMRKPECKIEEMRDLIKEIPACYHNRIVIHEHFDLLKDFNLCGVHLNRRNPKAPKGWKGHISISCHSFEELAQKKEDGYIFADGSCNPFDYLSLSPIFDSISKQGYNSAFSIEDLNKAKLDGIIDKRVLALGGICSDNVGKALEFGFGGVMVLGDAWKGPLQIPPKVEGCKTARLLPIVLSIAGSDPSAGAGIQQDLKTITNCGGYGATVITAITSQNTMGVQGVMPVPAKVIESQLHSIFDDLDVRAVKIGMIPNLDAARVIIKVLRKERNRRILPIVCDPIMLSTSGTRLMSEDCISLVIRELFPMCTLVTPNLPEYEVLHAEPYMLEADTCNLLIKGGHAKGESMTDVLVMKEEMRQEKFSSEMIETKNLHGTGCTLSSAIATYLASGNDLCSAVAKAKVYMNRAIEGGKELNIGHGNGPLWSK